MEDQRVDRFRKGPESGSEVTGKNLPMGLGGIDLDAVLAALPTDYDGWIVVEVDRASMDPVASVETCWRWVEERLR